MVSYKEGKQTKNNNIWNRSNGQRTEDTSQTKIWSKKTKKPYPNEKETQLQTKEPWPERKKARAATSSDLETQTSTLSDQNEQQEGTNRVIDIKYVLLRNYRILFRFLIMWSISRFCVTTKALYCRVHSLLRTKEIYKPSWYQSIYGSDPFSFLLLLFLPDHAKKKKMAATSKLKTKG